ncbi:MAG: alpha/beta fold hydrolase [Halieaceae bacterium]|nr:alpha/beta fold hydrolase [Halieaceae bacterium]
MDSTHERSQERDHPATTWLSEGLEVLIAELAQAPVPEHQPHFDVIIIGSGYGGSIAASRLAWAQDEHGKRLNVCLLERGKEYLPGMFPSEVSSLAGHVRLTTPRTWNAEQEREQGKAEASAQGLRDGLFDIRVDDDYNVLVANGLGGGSLINAGVMEIPSEGFFDEGWPDAVRDDPRLMDYYPAMKRELGAADATGIDNTIARHPDTHGQQLHKYSALRKLATGSRHARFREAAITVAMDDGDNQAGVAMQRCTLCGDCATGCNFGAKESLDLNLLARARRGGLRIVTGATVLEVREADSGLWELTTVHTLPTLAAKEPAPTRLRAGKIIIAAGALGSTEILMRSRAAGLAVSGKVGSRFSGNGDMIAVGYDMKPEINAVADETEAFRKRRVGPTITGVVDCRGERHRHPVVIEEMAVPGAMRWVFEELYTTVNSLRQLATVDWCTHTHGHPTPDPLSVNKDAIRHSQVYAVIGDDGAGGRLEFREDFLAGSDGAISVTWPEVRDHPLFPAQIEQLETLAERSGSGGNIIPNPMWQPLPADLAFLTGNLNGPLMTVHPLGGCPMGDSGATGVVNHRGQVFRGDDESVHAGLVVLDGAILPKAVGTNPALTIAAISARAVNQLFSSDAWNLQAVEEHHEGYRSRPRFDEPRAPTERRATEMQFAERLRGPVSLYIDGEQKDYMAEVTLFFKDKPLHELTAAEDDGEYQAGVLRPRGDKHRLEVADRSPATHKRSQLRLISMEAWQRVDGERLSGREFEERLDAESDLIAPLSGSLTILARERSNALQRGWRALKAYMGNRGWRELYQSRHPLPHEPQSGGAGWRTLWSGLKHLTRAGEVRLFEYQLQIGKADKRFALAPIFHGKTIRGNKRIGYMRRGNPLRQLMEVDLNHFPGLVPERPARLVLRPEFLARKGLPLFRISQQENLVLALTEVGSLAAYFLRLLINTHLLSLRAPDTAAPRPAQRLPGTVPGLPPFEVYGQRVTRLPPGVPESHQGNYRLTRYPRHNSTQPPVLMIHGYSASGTTFAHHAVNPNLAGYLWDRGRDVWILDMRSSCGMPTSRRNYSFEEIAYADIPLAVDEVCRRAGVDKLDVVAHCMGSAMLSMAVLTAGNPPADATYPEKQRLLPGRINRLVMSQVGPLVCLAPENVFRAYAFSYLKNFLPLDQYQFEPTGAGFDGVLDRFLAVLPYDDEEFDLENPQQDWVRTPWTRTRHRMDLLYGRTFSLKNLAPETLEHIDDLFGPLSVDTATQVLHFARYQTITDHSGNNCYVSREQLAASWRFPTLSIHGRENGLSWRATVGRLRRLLHEDAGRSWRSVVFDEFGHQDSLIGRGAEKVFAEINSFLEEPDTVPTHPPCQDLCLQPPWSGPVMLLPDDDQSATLPVSFGVNPALSKPRLLLSILLCDHPAGHRLLGRNGAPVIEVHAIDPDSIEYNWCRLEVDWPSSGDGHDRVLLLLVYDESPLLDNAVFGKEPGNIDEFVGAADLDPDLSWLTGEQLDLARATLGEAGEALQPRLHEALMEGAFALRHGILRLPERDNNADRLVVAAGSCQFPPGILDQWPGFNSYFRLACGCYNPEFPHPDLLLLSGDQIYVDSTAGMFDPAALDERYQHPYQRFYRSSAARATLREVPAAMMLDDHEIVDNWEPLPNDEENWQRQRDGLEYFRVFQRSRERAQNPHQWYSFRRKGFDFFMLDSRSERSHRHSAGLLDADMLHDAQRRPAPDENQWQALEAWLQQGPRDKPRFIVCPAMPFPQERRAIADLERYGEEQSAQRFAAAVHSDTWTGYPASLAKLVELIRDSGLENLVMINGDAHLGCVAEVTLDDGNTRFWAVHASGLYAPLPFANTSRADLAACEPLELADGIRGQVHTSFAPHGDGFALISVERTAGGWKIAVSYDREGEASGQVWQQQIPLQCGCARPVP